MCAGSGFTSIFANPLGSSSPEDDIEPGIALPKERLSSLSPDNVLTADVGTILPILENDPMRNEGDRRTGEASGTATGGDSSRQVKRSTSSGSVTHGRECMTALAHICTCLMPVGIIVDCMQLCCLTLLAMMQIGMCSRHKIYPDDMVRLQHA